MSTNDAIHYNSSMKIPSTFKSQGEGECGQHGTITGWHGVVSCKNCLKIIQKEKAQAFASMKNSGKGDLRWTK